jgi:hypothetical protein
LDLKGVIRRIILFDKVCTFQLRKGSQEVTMHVQVLRLTELYQKQAAFIPQGGDWRWLPNEDIKSDEGKILGCRL